MVTKILQITFLSLAFSLQSLHLYAQDTRTQYPSFLSNSYVNLNLGYINFPFSTLQMEPGFQAKSIHIRHLGMRIVLGHKFNRYISAQISYMKPLMQTVYENVNADQSNHSVWMHSGTLTLRPQLPLKKKFSVYGEAGLGIITRRGFSINNSPVVRNASYGSFLVGGGLRYQLTNRWDLVAGSTYSPANQSVQQPHTVYFSGGLTYNIQPIPAKLVEENSITKFIFPKNVLQVGYTTNALGYAVNNVLSQTIFFGGRAEVAQGFWIRYQRNLFHTSKFFSLDEGVSFGRWQSNRNKNEFNTLSVFPVFRLTVVHSKPADFYFHYSVAGPSFISKTNIDGFNTGKHFTFQDFMGIGVFTGKNRSMDVEINVNHYSNGNIFPDNAAVKIPLSFSLGYTF